MIHQRNSPSGSNVLTAEDAVHAHDGAQLSKLSSVLNGLEFGAQVMQRNVQEAVRAVKAGTYRVDAMLLSKRIVGEAMRAV
jgi:hypothetical protein